MSWGVLSVELDGLLQIGRCPLERGVLWSGVEVGGHIGFGNVHPSEAYLRRRVFRSEASRFAVLRLRAGKIVGVVCSITGSEGHVGRALGAPRKARSDG